MNTKIIFSMISIGLGLLLIIAGLGYTVNQASNYTTTFMHVNEEGDSLPEDNSVNPADSTSDRNPKASDKETKAPNAIAAALPYDDSADSPSLFIPALAILSGAVFAVMGAIALAHRLRGIN